LPEYRLRPATDADRDRIAEIWHASASLPDVGPPVMPSREDLRERVHREMAGGWDVTVAVAGAEIVGFVALRPAERVLAELFLDPAGLGNGTGRLLLDHAKAAMPGGFTLFTTSANLRARHFYEREGLKRLRETPHPRSGHPVTYYEWPGGTQP
jgi:ribosomal protein S18 acetylase RimI-like enzyme